MNALNFGLMKIIIRKELYSFDVTKFIKIKEILSHDYFL